MKINANAGHANIVPSLIIIHSHFTLFYIASVRLITGEDDDDVNNNADVIFSFAAVDTNNYNIYTFIMLMMIYDGMIIKYH